jgi:biopolymer transport protein TolQ
MMLSLLLQVGRAVPTTPWELVTHATTVTQVVLVILVLLSLFSWAIMLLKWREFRGASAAAHAFMRDFEHASSLEDARRFSVRAPAGPFARVFARGMDFLGQTRSTGMASEIPVAGQATATLSGSQVEALRLVLDAETTIERDRLGRFIPSLAVIGSVSPLLGLLGTVLGVIDAFIGIATQGSGNIAAVAPGVAEALIATAVALATAIPAVFGYNIFASRLNRFENELDAFGTEMIALLVREGHI